jgi:hypothetical protein
MAAVPKVPLHKFKKIKKKCEAFMKYAFEMGSRCHEKSIKFHTEWFKY